MLNKKIIANIGNMRDLLMVTICVDTTNCYNRVVHAFASICV